MTRQMPNVVIFIIVVSFIFIGALALTQYGAIYKRALLLGSLYNKELQDNEILDNARKQLLNSLFPEDVIERIMRGDKIIADSFKDVTVYSVTLLVLLISVVEILRKRLFLF